MGEVLSFKNKKKSESAGVKKKKQPGPAPALKKGGTFADNQPKNAAPSSAAKSKKKKDTLNAESIKLWWISQEFDELIRKAVIEKHIPVEELSAVMAHRLGSLLVVSERTPELTLFCLKIISKITNQKESGTNAS